MSCETPKPEYANSLLVYPANGRGLPTLKCCSVNCGSGSVETCVGTCFAASQPCRAAAICGLFFSASASNSESEVATPACEVAGSWEKAVPPNAEKSKSTEILRQRTAHDKCAAEFLCVIENILFS